MKTYRELKVGDTLYLLTGELTFVKTVILVIRQESHYIRFNVKGEMPNRTYEKYVDRNYYYNSTRSFSTATNLRDIKILRAERIADRNKCLRHEKILRT